MIKPASMPLLCQHLAFVDHVPPLNAFYLGELKALQNITHPKRRMFWLRGRMALKQIRAIEGKGTDISQIDFPNARYSISHGRAFSLAIVNNGVKGVGVDFQAWQKVNPNMSRWFLTEAESTWLNTFEGKEHEREFIRLWTIKEALFKAARPNEDISFSNFELPSPWAKAGWARLNGQRRKLRWCYQSWLFPCGALTLANCLNR